MYTSFILNKIEDISDVEEQTGARTGFIRPLPLEDALRYGLNKLNLFMVKYGLYCFPTNELIDHLRWKINGRKAIEIGCGMGVIGRELGIPITDNKSQNDSLIQSYYKIINNPAVDYPEDVIEIDAIEAVLEYKPTVVIGSYVTHKMA